MIEKDTLFSDRLAEPGDFVFDERVARVFPDMISRSIPGYGLVVPMIGLLARRYAQSGSALYDLGCSLGAVTLAMRGAVNTPATRIVAVDNSGAMIARLRESLETERGGIPVELIEGDVRAVPIEDASIVVLNFTLQFIDRESRAGLLRTIAAGMRAGGALILSEKARFDDPAEGNLQAAWHHDFKRAMGYSDLEIAQKRDALENVLQPDSEREHLERLRACGFRSAYRWFQAFNFLSFIAFR